MTASIHVHGTPGRSLLEGGSSAYRPGAVHRGAFTEQAVARVLALWLSRRPDGRSLHLFHDLAGFRDVTGHGFGPVSLGAANIDHVVLSGARRLVIDAKGTGTGVLTTDTRSRGLLVQAAGLERPERWLDTRT